MPGIFGVIDRDPGPSAVACQRLEIARRMSASMCYEDDYISDIVSSPLLGACAGRVGRPYVSPAVQGTPRSWSSALLTTGEGVITRTASRTDAEDFRAVGFGAHDLAREIHLDGVKALSDMDGACAGFFMNPQDGQCVLFNDRYGMERLFVYRENGRVYFSSEAKAILAVAPSASAPDLLGLAEWLSCGCTTDTRSLFQNVEILAGGTALVFPVGGDARPTRFFDRAQLEQLPLLPESRFVEEFTDSLGAAANAAINQSPRAALSLTGGIDSRLILASLDAAPQTVPCYTFGSMYRQTMDASVANAIASQCHQPHQVLKLGQDFLTGIHEHFQRASYVSDGYLGLAGSAELYLNRLARQVAPARVTGNWGGELMRGVRAFKFREPKGDFIRAPIRELLPEVAETFARTSDCHPLTYTLFHQMPHQGFGRYAVERSQLQMRSPFLANNVVKALYQSSAAMRSSIEVVLKVLARRPGLIAVPTDTGRLGQSSAAVQFFRQAYRRMMVKAEYLTSHGAPDWMAGLSTRAPSLETAFLGRDKFQHFRHWTRHELSGFVRETLRSDDTGVLTACFDMRRVSVMVEEHIAGRANYTEELDKVMTVAMLRRTIGSSAPLSSRAGTHSHQEIALEMRASV
jgi:asparagine synthase (glutamine-hydrolysing)